MALGRDTTGAYAATTALAFPDTADRILSVPVNSSVAISPEVARIRPIVNPPASVAAIPSAQTLTEVIISKLRTDSPKTLADLSAVAREMWPEGTLDQRGMAVFEVLLGICGNARSASSISACRGSTTGAPHP